MSIQTTSSILTEEQIAAKDKIIDWFHNSDNSYMILSGSGGTGKTTLVSELLNHLEDCEIILTGTTHKCLELLKSRTSYWLYTDAMTVHKFLGLRPEPDAYGKLRLEGKAKKQFTAELVIVDESSMVGSGLWEWIEIGTSVYTGTPGFNQIKWLFVGDKAQVNPVGESKSTLFDRTLPTVELKTIVRHKGNLLNFVSRVRDRGETELDSWDRTYTSFSKFRGDFLDCAISKEPGDCVYLGWTNKAIDQMREELRLHLYDATPEQMFVEGEIIRASTDVYRTLKQEDDWKCLEKKLPLLPAMEGDVVGKSSHIFQVLSVNILAPGFYPYWTYSLKLRNLSTRFAGVGIGVTTAIHPSSLEDYRADLKKIADAATAWKVAHQKKDGLGETQSIKLLTDLGFKGMKGRVAQAAWAYYFNVQRLFSTFSSPYVITVHKAQGSDYQNVWVDCADIFKNRNVQERERILYTAVTRSKENLALYLPR